MSMNCEKTESEVQKTYRFLKKSGAIWDNRLCIPFVSRLWIKIVRLLSYRRGKGLAICSRASYFPQQLPASRNFPCPELPHQCPKFAPVPHSPTPPYNKSEIISWKKFLEISFSSKCRPKFLGERNRRVKSGLALNRGALNRGLTVNRTFTRRVVSYELLYWIVGKIEIFCRKYL